MTQRSPSRKLSYLPCSSRISNPPSGKMIGVTVGDGPTAVKFTVHIDIFMKASKAFEKAAKGGDSAKFGDTSPEIFAVVLNWIYTDSIKMPKKEGEDEDVFSDLIKLYAVAEALAIPGLKNDVLDKVMIEAVSKHPITPQTKLIHKLPVCSPRRSYGTSQRCVRGYHRCLTPSQADD